MIEIYLQSWIVSCGLQARMTPEEDTLHITKNISRTCGSVIATGRQFHEHYSHPIIQEARMKHAFRACLHYIMIPDYLPYSFISSAGGRLRKMGQNDGRIRFAFISQPIPPDDGFASLLLKICALILLAPLCPEWAFDSGNTSANLTRSFSP